MDTVLKLRELRRLRGLTQQEVADRCGVGVKTISTFESGTRIDALKLSQLERVITVYGVTLAEFFSPRLDCAIAPWDVRPEDAAIDLVTQRLGALPTAHRLPLAEKILAMLDAVVLPPHHRRPAARSAAPLH